MNSFLPSLNEDVMNQKKRVHSNGGVMILGCLLIAFCFLCDSVHNSHRLSGTPFHRGDT